MDKPQLLEIQIAEDKGEPMQSLDTVNAIKGLGLEGDRYATGKGAFSNSKREVERHMSLIESEAIEAVRQESGIEVTFADTRRNLLTTGVRLNDLVGKRFKIGDVLVEGVELCDPCARPGVLSATEGLRGRFKDLFDNRGGLRVKIIGEGEIKAGDVIDVEQ